MKTTFTLREKIHSATSDTRKHTRPHLTPSPIAAGALLTCLLAACGGGGGDISLGPVGNLPSGTPLPHPSPISSPSPNPTPTAGPAALETCPASPAGASAPAVATGLEVQSSSGWSNATGQLSAVANGTRTGRESGLRSGVNCVSWKDANGKARALNLGAYLFDYVMNWGATRYVATDDAAGHPGFGYVVSHNNQNGNSPLGSFMDPSSVKTTVFAGANHAIHRVTLNYTRDTEAGGQGIVVPVVIEWMVAAGRNDPVWAVNWKMNQAQNPQGVNFNTYRMDSRGPYGSIGWDGKTHSSGQDLAVLGVEWGAGGYEFQAVRMGGLNSGAGWNYQLLSPINYAKAFPIETVPVEFGIVQTKRDPFMGYPDGVGGRLEGKTSPTYGKACAATNTYMPCAQDWPYQMMQYSAPDGSFANTPTTGKLMAWGTPYGYLGADTVDSFDYNFTTAGTGERSYATYIVWGEYGAVDTGQNPVEAAKHYADAASYWTTTQAIGGIGAVATTATLPGSMQTRALPANGYNETYGTFEFVVTADNRADIRIMNMGQANTGTVLRRPVLVFNNYNGGVPQLKLGVTPLVSGVDYLASYDTASHRLWVTLMYDAIAQQGFHVVLN